MSIAIWIVAGLLAAIFALAGAMKLTTPRAQLQEKGQGWAGDFSDGIVKLIGALELLAAIGLIAPAAINIAPILVPMAACGLIAMMTGAAITHLRRHEPQMAVVNVVLFALAAFVAWGRFGPYQF